MKIYKYEIPDDLIYRYANYIDDLGGSRMFAHEAIFKHLDSKYPEFNHYFSSTEYAYAHDEKGKIKYKDDKPVVLRSWESHDISLYPRIEWVQEHIKELEERVKENPERKHYHGYCTVTEALEIFKFVLEFDKVLNQIAHHPTPGQRHMMNKVLGEDYSSE